jgi:hypothetical protein
VFNDAVVASMLFNLPAAEDVKEFNDAVEA